MKVGIHSKLPIVIVCLLVIFAQACNAGSKVANDVPVGTKVGQKAPEIKLNNPDNNLIHLTSLQGNIVLIDFWASWCAPCRRNNPYLVKLYNKYKDKKFKHAKSFEIYSVSLDRKKGSWVKAIEQDKLEWEYHVSDLQYWYSEAASDYKVNAIPTTFLIDANGLIIARNPSLHDVDILLSERTK